MIFLKIERYTPQNVKIKITSLEENEGLAY